MTIEHIKQQIFSAEIDNLVAAFDGSIPENMDVYQRISWLVGFSDIWDYRRQQKKAQDGATGENARWLIQADLTAQQEQATMMAARVLGLIGKQIPISKEYDYVLVLGGARMSCLFRMKYAKELCEQYGVHTERIVGLTGMRPIAETERDFTDTYAPEAETEFDLMCAAVRNTFQGTNEVNRQSHIRVNKNASWVTAEYDTTPSTIILAAPSTEPKIRRANTADTFTFFKEKSDLETNKRLLLVTSQIYVPYQQMEALRILGIPDGHEIEAVGFPVEWSAGMQGLQTPVNYLQEIRSTLLAMEKLLCER